MRILLFISVVLFCSCSHYKWVSKNCAEVGKLCYKDSVRIESDTVIVEDWIPIPGDTIIDSVKIDCDTNGVPVIEYNILNKRHNLSINLIRTKTGLLIKCGKENDSLRVAYKNITNQYNSTKIQFNTKEIQYKERIDILNSQIKAKNLTIYGLSIGLLIFAIVFGFMLKKLMV